MESLRFFKAAARRESSVQAARELDVTAAAVAYRVKTLENHIGQTLFDHHNDGRYRSVADFEPHRPAQTRGPDIPELDHSAGGRRDPVGLPFHRPAVSSVRIA